MFSNIFAQNQFATQNTLVQPAPAFSSLGTVAQTIDNFQRSYAPLKATSGKWVSSGEGKPNDDCDFKTIVYKQRTAAASHDPLLSGPILEQANNCF